MRPAIEAIRPAPAADAAPIGLRDVSAGPESRRRRPPFRPGLVARQRLVARLAGRNAPLALVVGPAGYGKTTALAEWAEQDERPFAWITLDRDDDDPVRLLSSIAFALDEIEPVGREIFAALSGRRAASADVVCRRLARSIAGRRRPFVLVLDDVHLVRARAAFAVLATLVDHVPTGSQLALASRTEPELLPVGRLRAHRRLVELRPRDLAMTRGEAAVLLRGLGLASSDVDVLVERTEGWPAGLYLAAPSVRDQPDRDRALARFGGDDRLVADYLRDELLAGLSPDRMRFLTRTSVLDDLSGPLCDAVLSRLGSGSTLRELARSNAMVVPLDRADGRYRYHGLFADMLQAELRRLEPEREMEVHRRASAWHARSGDVERAIHHAIAAADVDTAGDLLWSVAGDYVMSGRHRPIRRWLDRFSAEQIAQHAPLALTAATSELATGDRDLLEHWCVAAERRLAPAGGAATADAAVATLMRAVVARDGVARMGRDAGVASEQLPRDATWQGLCALVEGVARHLTGDRAGGRAELEEGARRAAVAAPVVQVLCLAQLGVLALEEGDPDTAQIAMSRARAQIERAGLADYPTCALAFAASALERAGRGRVDEARGDMRDGLRLLAALGDFTPWYEAEARVLLARAALRLSDVARARTLLAEASRIARHAPDAVVLSDWLAAAWARADSFAAAAVRGPSSLTTAELRVLRLLPTHLSFREIAGSLHVSANTIKTQAHAVYRKLDASSRNDAVQNARRIGLLDA
jgi:LuxR family transcriptional regulator, maltose regulon positive regulatory protein